MSIVNYAHRGASEYYPENTLWSFYAGLEMGADGIETDIQRTSDGVLVLHHDDTLERVAGEKGAIRDYTYAQLAAMDFGRFKDQRFEGERIVTLETFLTHFGNHHLHLALEIKQFGVEEQTLACIAAHGCRASVTLTSFIWESMERVRRLDAQTAAGFLTERITDEMRLARERGFSVRFWGVKNEELMRRALALGGDGMTVNFPDKLTAALKSEANP